MAGDLLGRGLAHVRQDGADGGDLFGQGLGPQRLVGGPGRRAHIQFDLLALGDGNAACGVLVIGAQPADQAHRLLGGAGAVQIDQARQDGLVVPIGGPAIGLGHGGVDAIVDALQDAHKARVIGFPVASLDPFAGAQFFQHVVERRQGQSGMRGGLRLAMRVQFLAQAPQAGFLGFGGIGKGEGVEAKRLVVARAILQRAACLQGPGNMDAAGQHGKRRRVVQADGDQHVVRQGFMAKKLEETMLGRFHRGDVAGQAFQGRTQLRARLSMQPPKSGILRAVG